jgi:hypothetical protein
MMVYLLTKGCINKSQATLFKEEKENNMSDITNAMLMVAFGLAAGTVVGSFLPAKKYPWVKHDQRWRATHPGFNVKKESKMPTPIQK